MKRFQLGELRVAPESDNGSSRRRNGSRIFGKDSEASVALGQGKPVAKLVLDIERSVQMRTTLRQKLATNQEIDLVEEWNEIEQLDLGIACKIRKRPIE